MYRKDLRYSFKLFKNEYDISDVQRRTRGDVTILHVPRWLEKQGTGNPRGSPQHWAPQSASGPDTAQTWPYMRTHFCLFLSVKNGLAGTCSSTTSQVCLC